MTTATTSVGIDPGLSGAVAALDGSGQVFFLERTPTVTVKTSAGKNRRRYDVREMDRLLRSMMHGESATTAVVGLEDVHAMPGQGVTSMFSFGRGLGTWEGLIVALGFRYELVGPRRWTASMLKDQADKGKPGAYIVACRLFPDQRLAKGSGEVDALLIAEYVRRTFVLPFADWPGRSRRSVAP